MSKPVEIEFLMKDGISAGLNKIKSFTESVKSKALMTADEFAEVQRYVLELRNVVALLETQLEDLRLVGQAASPDLDQSQNIAQIESLESQIKELETELKQLQNVSENVKVTPSELPNAQKKFNGLHNSIQQMAREMPSLAMGPQMFFLAISNNLPIFADEVKRAKEEYADLIKNGEKGEPVWKQILSSLFSWQTALTTGIMLLTMYGDKIIQWAKNLRTAENDSESLRKAIGESEKAIIAERVQIDNLFNSLKSAKEGTKEYVEAKKAIIDQYGSYLTGLSAEVQSLQDIETAYKAITRAAEESARARAKEAYIKEEADNYAEEMGNVRVDVKKLLEDKFGKEKGGEYYWKIVPILDGEKMTDEVRDIVSQFDEKKLRMVGSGMSASYVEMTTNDLKSQLTSAAILRNQLDRAVSNANDRFSIPGGDPEKEIIKNKEYWENYINEQQRLLDAMTEEQLLTEDAQKIRSNILEAQKKLEAYNVQSSKSGENKGTRDERADLDKELKDASKERQELEKELYFQEQQNRINLETNERKRKEAQMRLDHEKELYNLEQQKQSAIDAEIERQRAIFDAVENTKASKDDKYVKKTFSEEDIDKTEIDKITESYSNLYKQIEKIQQKERDEINNDEEKAQNEYLSKYGSFLERIEAITKLYAERIQKAATEGERKTLEAERNNAIKAIEQEMNGNGINWDNIFADVSHRSVESLKAMRAEIRNVIIEGKDLSASDMSRLYEQYNKVGEAIEESSFSLRKLMGYTNEDVEYAKQLKEEYEELKNIYEELVALQNQHQEASNNANSALVDFMKKNTGQDVTGQESEQTMKEMLQDNNATEETMSEFDNLYSKNEDASKQLANTTKNVQGAGKAMEAAGAAMQSAGSSAGSTIAFIDKIIHMVNDNVQSAVGVMEELGLEDTKAGKFTEKFAESSQYATQAWESLKSGNIMGVVHGVLGSLRTLGEGLGQLGIAGFGSNNADLPEQLEHLTRSNENLKQSMDRLSDAMEEANAQEAADLHQQQQDNLDATISGTQNLMDTAGSTYSNGFLGIGGSHSSDYFINENMSSTDWSRMNQILKENGFDSTVNQAGDLWFLSPEEMEAIATGAPDLWTKLQDAIAEGYAGEELIELMNDYIGLAGQANEIADEYKEKITGISFEGVRDNFKSNLLDMNTDAAKMSENIGETMLNGIVENMMSGKYNDRLQEWYEEFANAMIDGVLSDEESEYLNDLYNGIAEDAIAERDALLDAAGIDPEGFSQSGKQGGFNAMSQEQGTKLEGLFVSAQMHLVSIDERQEDVAETMSAALGHLQKIEENTSDCKDSLDEINNNIKTIIRDGVKAI